MSKNFEDVVLLLAFSQEQSAYLKIFSCINSEFKGTQKIPFTEQKIISNKEVIEENRSRTVTPLYVSHDVTCWTRWRHEFTENIITLKLEYCFTNNVYLFWDTLHTYHLIRKVLDFIDHPSYWLIQVFTFRGILRSSSIYNSFNINI